MKEMWYSSLLLPYYCSIDIFGIIVNVCILYPIYMMQGGKCYVTKFNIPIATSYKSVLL